jgi:hypothetical protein
MSRDQRKLLLRPDHIGLAPPIRRPVVPDDLHAVRTVWLLGAGHTALDCDWPEALRTECEELLGALTPRAAVETYVPDRDYLGRHIDGRKFAEGLRIEIKRVTGGQTTIRTDADFSPHGRPELVEITLVVKTFMPTVVSDGLRMWFIDLVIDLGLRADQDVILIEVSGHSYWIKAGLLRIQHSLLNSTNGEGALP